MQLFQRMVFLSFLSGIFILLGWVVQNGISPFGGIIFGCFWDCGF